MQEPETKRNPRIPLLDEIRGFAILCMIVYHFAFDLVNVGLISIPFFHSPWMNGIRDLFAGLFILISGFCCLLSQSNWKRGGLCLLAALFVSMGAGLFGANIPFGILHLLGTCMLLAALMLHPILRLPPIAGILLAVIVAILTWTLPGGRFFGTELPSVLTRTGALYPLGIPSPDFSSVDYFPLLPWGLVFFAGIYVGKLLLDRKLPGWALKSHSRFLALCGRNTLFLYLLHQPLLTGILWLWQAIF